MAYIFLDESGQFTKHNNEEYFVVASFTVSEPRRTEKKFKGWCKTRFPKRMRGQNEIKWSTAGLTQDLRLKTLRYIAHLDVRIRFVYLLRNNIPETFTKKDKLESGLLYTHVIGEMLNMYLPIEERELRVFCDRRHLKGMKETDFNKILMAQLLPNLPKNSIIQIGMKDSTADANIQIADWIAGALSWYLEAKPSGEEYFTIFKNNILGEGKELFQG